MAEFCRFFLSGYCKYGHYCHFRHDFETLDSNGICSLWAAGYFCDGECGLSHPSPEDNATLAPPDEEHEAPPASRNFADTAGVPICKFYLKGVCSKGSACYFFHPTPTTCGETSPTKHPDNKEAPKNPEQPLAVFDCKDVSIAEDVQLTRGGGGRGKREDVGMGVSAPAEDWSSTQVEGDFIALSGEKHGTGRSESLRSTAGEAVLEGVTEGTGRIVRAKVDQAPTLSAHTNTIARPCWFYSRGRCKKGAKCLFSHAMQPAGGEAEVTVTLRKAVAAEKTSDTAVGKRKTVVTDKGRDDRLASQSQAMGKAKAGDKILSKRRRLSFDDTADGEPAKRKRQAQC